MGNWRSYGAQQLCAAFTDGNQIAPLFQEAVNDALKGVSPERFSGMVEAALSLAAEVERQRLAKPGDKRAAIMKDPAPIALEIERAAAARDRKKLGALLGDIAGTLEGIRKAVPGITASIATPAAPLPIPVHVLSMPQRETVTTLERDSKGDLIRATQTEKGH